MLLTLLLVWVVAIPAAVVSGAWLAALVRERRAMTGSGLAMALHVPGEVRRRRSRPRPQRTDRRAAALTPGPGIRCRTAGHHAQVRGHSTGTFRR